MSDPVTNVEIEDVLSSIRRLVADDARDKSAPQSGTAKPERLVLTPAQRVPGDGAAPAPSAASRMSTQRSAPDNRLRSEPERASASDGHETKAVPFRLNRETTPESPSREGPDAAAAAPRSESETLGPAAAARRLTLGLTASDDEFEEIYDEGGDEPSFDRSTLLGKLVEEELARALASPETDARPKFARSRPAQRQEAEPAAGPQDAGAGARLQDRHAEAGGVDAADDGIPTAEVPLPEPELPEMSARMRGTEEHGEASLAQKIASLEAMIALHKGAGSSAQQDASALQGAQQAPESDEAQSVETVRAAFVHRPQKPLEWQDHKPEQVVSETVGTPGRSEALVLEGPTWKGADRSDVPAEARHFPNVAASEHGDTMPAPVDLFDEEMLRDLVTEIIREELQGALGERITRNVRKMVRREIHRMVTSEHFD